MRFSDWSSDVFSSDMLGHDRQTRQFRASVTRCFIPPVFELFKNMRDLQCLHAAEGGVVIHQEIKAGRFQTPLPLFLTPEFRALRNPRFIGLFVKAAPILFYQNIYISLIAPPAH